MKAEPAVQRRLLDLADLDAELARLDHRRATLPELARLVDAEAAVRTAKDKVVEVETTAADLDRDIRRIERDVDGVRTRTARDHQLLTTAAAKQAVDLQHELETLAKRQAVLEDEQLEVMEQREAVGADIEHGKVVLATAEHEVDELAAARDSGFADIDAARAGRSRDRTAAAAEIPSDLLTAYDRRRAQHGVGAAALVGRRCQSCRLELDRATLAELRAAPADDVVRCEECGVILVRTPDSGL